MDGAVLGDANPAEYETVMADGSRHRYVRTQAAGDVGVPTCGPGG